MKVLVTGGYGFIGSHVVDRFYEEGNEIFIIDNLSSGSIENVSCKHKAFNLNVEDKKYDEIFRNYRFDVVVHLAAQVNVANSIENPFVDTQTNILGLVNMLELSAKYKVKKFIFASSAAIYGNNENLPLKEEDKANPLSPYGISKYLGEQYCSKWKEIYDLDTVCFRFSNVYGPRQGTVGEGGVVSIYMSRVLNEQGLVVFGDGNQTRDFIYVSDVAEAIYRAAESYITGVYNLSTKTQSSVNDLLKIINGLHKVEGISYVETRNGDILHSSLDNTKVKKALDWIPLYNLEDGIHNTYKWYEENNSQKVGKLTRKDKRKNNYAAKEYFRRLLPYIENVMIFTMIYFLNQYFGDDFVLKTINLNLIYIIFISITYGANQSIISIVLSCALFIIQQLSIGHDLVSMLLDTSVILNMAVYILIGMLINYTIDKKERQTYTYKATIEELEEKYQFLRELYNDTYNIKAQLQDQIVNSEDSVGKIYGVIRELDSLEPQYIFKASIGVLENLLKSDEISIYTLNRTKKYLRLTVKSGKYGFNVKKTISTSDLKEAKGILEGGNVFVNKTMQEGLPIMMAPIKENDSLIGVIMLHNVDFERLTLYYVNLFKIFPA